MTKIKRLLLADCGFWGPLPWPSVKWPAIQVGASGHFYHRVAVRMQGWRHRGGRGSTAQHRVSAILSVYVS